MPRKRHIMGLFTSEDKVVSAINALKESSYEFIRVNTPIPSHKIMDALKLKSSRVGWFTLCGGILGFLSGFALERVVRRFVLQLTDFVREPRCPEVQADGVPCDTPDADCEQCLKIQELLNSLHNALPRT